MTNAFVSLTIIASIAAFTPIIVRIIPRQIIPETVILIGSGAVLGPHSMNIISADSQPIKLLAELGCAFLFLLAGYEISPKAITGKDGKKGFFTWIATFLIGLGISYVMPDIAIGTQGLIATALLFTTTALGALMPIIKERGLKDTYVGDLVIAYGTWGEVATVLAMATLLSTRQTWKTTIILFAMLGLCIWIAALGNKAFSGGTTLYQFLESKSKTTSQTMVRLTMLILLLLVAFSSVLDLDIVLGAFAAGFVLRYIIPDDNYTLEDKLNGLGHGFLIPVFFVISGCSINIKSVADKPILLISFILALIFIRTLPIVFSLSLERDENRKLDLHNRFSVGFYCTTALPLIVAITSIAVKDGIMNDDVASVLVAAGAITIFLMPYFGGLTYSVVDAEPIQAFVEIIHSPKEFNSIIHKHIELTKERRILWTKQKKDLEDAYKKYHDRVKANKK